MITPLGKTSSLTVIILCLKSLVTMDIGYQVRTAVRTLTKLSKYELRQRDSPKIDETGGMRCINALLVQLNMS